MDIVIPSNKSTILTTESIPEHVPVHIERDGTLNEARNRGVRNADSDIVAILDDDIQFPPSLLKELEEQAAPEKLLGIADWNYGWVAGRVMVFYKETWENVGGFDETLQSHMGDTEFCLKFLRRGYKIERLPREVFYHEEHDRSITARDHAWRGLYLARKYPKKALHLFSGMVSEAI